MWRLNDGNRTLSADDFFLAAWPVFFTNASGAQRPVTKTIEAFAVGFAGTRVFRLAVVYQEIRPLLELLLSGLSDFPHGWLLESIGLGFSSVHDSDGLLAILN